LFNKNLLLSSFVCSRKILVVAAVAITRQRDAFWQRPRAEASVSWRRKEEGRRVRECRSSRRSDDGSHSLSANVNETSGANRSSGAGCEATPFRASIISCCTAACHES
jgi:hypothetical protein